MALLSLVIPGLFGGCQVMTGHAAPRADALCTLLARATQRAAPSATYEELLCGLFGIAGDAQHDLPVAALAWLGEGGAMDAGYWLRADPVHLRADRANAVLFGPDLLEVQSDEALQLAAAFNAQFATEGWYLEAPHPQRWYLRMPDAPGLRTHALYTVLGRNVDALLPAGDEALRWRAVLNEVQMLFHMHPVNRQREEDGRLTINSVWFWGGGRLPKIGTASFTRVCSDEPLARGLARAAGIGCGNVPRSAADWAIVNDTASLVTLTQLRTAARYGDDAWRISLEALECDWFAPLRDLLRRGALDELLLYPDTARAYHITRATLRRFWRRSRTLAAYLQSENKTDPDRQ